MSIINYNPNSNDKIVSFLGDTNQEQLVPISALGINQNIIYDNVTLTGTSAATTTTYLNYGTNVITTASLTNYAIRLPYPPIKGKSVTIINVSGYPIVVYPSVDGGSINNVVNSAATIPNDGESYVFTCWENPLPGAWSWRAPATAQYDSGAIVLPSPSTGRVSAASKNFLNLDAGNSASSDVAENGLGKPLFINNTIADKGIYFKPSRFWNLITKIKIYTNTNAPLSFSLKRSYSTNYYDITTGALVNSIGVGAGDYIIGNINTAVSGTFVPSAGQTYLSDFIGDDGTVYGIFNNASSVFTNSSIVGDKYLGTTIYNGNTVNVWTTGYIKLIVTPNALSNLAGFQFQFFIEYN